jgi:rubrerythrin
VSSMFFSDVEAAKIACNIERNGLAFYTAVAAKAEDANVRRVFEQLAADEKAHVAVFEELQQKLLDEPRKDGYLDSDELDAYMARLVETHVFADDSIVARLAEQVSSDIEALGVGMRAERDTMLFYHELLGFTDSAAARKAIERIIEEERQHLVQLHERSQQCENLHG